MIASALSQTVNAQQDFVKTVGRQFWIGNRPYAFMGVNMWYAGILGNTDEGKSRLIRELDFLKQQGVTNIRVMARAEGEGRINGFNRVSPALQPSKDYIDETVMNGFDFLLEEIGKRDIKVVIYLSNNWEWSGGFMQYLNWNGMLSDREMGESMEWERMRDVISQFYNCDGCTKMYENAVRHFVSRINSINGIPYRSDPSIMAWEIANEPRPMRPSAIPAFKKFIHHAAFLIKSIDNNHLVTTGSEGIIGSENEQTFADIHADSLIDYATMHIWPKNWLWYSDTSIGVGMNQVKKKTLELMIQNDSILQLLNKPLVLEEFGMPRDGEQRMPNTPYTHRIDYFRFIADRVFNDPQHRVNISGINFWAFSGEAAPNPNRKFWEEGDPAMGDPPFEPQGLNTVYESDSSIWKVVREVNSRFQK